METISRIEKYSDWLNPLLVRELRQSFRSRAFSGAIVLTSLFCGAAVVCGIIYSTQAGANEAVGMVVFNVIYFLLWAVSCILIPMDAANRFRTERTSGEYELFMITGIPSRSVVAGKLQASVAQSLLIISISAPFMMVCYLLKGVSAVNILVGILVIVVFTVTLTQLGILVGSFSCSKPLLAAMNAPFGICLVFSFIYIPVSMSFADLGGLFGARASIRDALLGTFMVLGHYFLLAYLSSVAMLELQNKNRTLLITAYLLLSAIIYPLILWTLAPPGELVQVLFYMLFVPAALISPFFIAVPISLSAKLGREALKFPLAGILRILLYQGRGSFIAWYSVFIAVLFAWEKLMFPNKTDFEFSFISLTSVSVFTWCLVGGFFHRWFSHVPVMFLSAIAVAIPSIASVFLVSTGKEDNYPFALLLCPLTFCWGLEKLSLQYLMDAASVAYWCLIFAYGVKCHFIQMKMEKNENVG